MSDATKGLYCVIRVQEGWRMYFAGRTEEGTNQWVHGEKNPAIERYPTITAAEAMRDSFTPQKDVVFATRRLRDDR